MRKLTIFLTLLLLSGICLLSALSFDPDWFQSRTLITCFKMESIGNFAGKIDFQVKDGIVQTNMSAFNALAKQYHVVDLKQAHEYVKNPYWNDEGKYMQCVYRVFLKDDSQMDAAMAAFNKCPDVLYSEFETINRSYYVPNDPNLEEQYFLAATHCYEAWDYTTGTDTELIGITDSGVKWNHPDLRENIWINQAELHNNNGTEMTIDWNAGTYSGGDGVDSPNDGNTKADDLMGYDFFSNDNNPYQNFAMNDHGTHVAGCAGAVFNNAIGGSGTCPNVSLICCKGASNTSASTGISYGYDMIKYAAESGAKVVNASWGGPGTGTYPNQVVNYIVSLGSLLVTAAGNANTEHGTGYSDYPADATNALCVAATGPTDVKTDFSDYGNTIDICAPGSGILSTIISGNGYASFDGTSMASPITAGIAALVRSVNPELTAGQLRQRLMDTADWIYNLNPTYQDPPLLGSGRVNAFAATMYDKIPYLTIEDQMLIENDGDGDGIANPGEAVNLKLQMNNRMDPYTGLMWAGATDVVAKLRCSYPGVVITDSTSTYGAIGSGVSLWNNTDPFTFTTISTLPSIPIPFQLDITANPNAQYPYHVVRDITVELSLVQAGWPIDLGGASQSSANVVDVNHDSAEEVVFGDQTGKIHVVNENGTELAGFPYQAAAGVVGSTAVGDVNGDYNQEIVACLSNNHVICLSATGAVLWDNTASGTIRTNPLIADLNLDGHNEVVAVTQTRYIHAYNSDGSNYPHFPIQIDGAMLAAPCVGDLNGDGQLEIVVGALNGSLHAINSATGTDLTGFPYALGSSTTNPPIIANVDADPQPEILISTSTTGVMHVVNHDGTVAFTKNIGQQVKTGVVVADVTGDAYKEIILIAYNGDVYVMNAAGVNLPGFPHSMGQNVECTPVVASFDQASTPAIIFGDTNGKLHSLRVDGTESPNFPYTIGGNLKVSPALSDLDDDNDFDIALPNDTGFYMLEVKRHASSFGWECYMGDNRRSGNNYQSTPVADPETAVLTTNLDSNYPNPFSTTTAISYSLKDASPVTLEVFNAKGQRVNTLVSTKKEAGNHKLNWDGKDMNGNRLPSGIYFFKMKAGSYTSTRKMILMK